ncbi:retrovirus-related pol polyprotein from transposon TNT 1-94 [Tanacetum coccineum]
MDYKTVYKKMKAKLTLLEASASTYQNPKTFQSKNKGLVAETFDWDEEEVANNEELTQVKVLMALGDDELTRHIREPIWYLNSGCSRSMTGVKSYLHIYVELPSPKIVFGDNSSCITEGYGSINCGGIVFSKVAFVNGLKYNVISMSQLCDAKYIVQFDDKQGTIFNANKEIMLITPKRNDVYVLEISSPTPNGACFFAKALESVNWLWYKRLSHLNFKNVNKLAKQNKVLGLPSLVYSKDKPCSRCEQGKHKRTLFKTKQKFLIRKCLHLLHMDLFRPTSPMSVDHEKYTLVIVDEYSRYTWVYFLRKKSHAAEMIMSFIRMVENQNDVKVKQIRIDNGTKFKNFEFESFVMRKEFLKTSLLPIHLNKMVCPLFIHNHKDHVEKHIPEVNAPNEHDITHTKDIACPPDPTNTKGIQEQNVQDEQISNQSTEETSGNNTETSIPITKSLVPEVIQSQNTNHASSSSHLVAQDRWSKDQHIELVNIIGDLGKDLLTRSMAAKLRAASASECLNKVSTLVPLPHGKIAIGSKWVFRNKKDEHGIVTKNKARLAAQGYSQEKGIDYDETCVPVARMEAIRIFLAFATYMNVIVFQKDVKSAFMNGKLKEEVYVKKPPGFGSSEFPDYVCKLDKALYGLKQAPRAWLQIKQDDEGISICQEQYTRNLLKKYEISNSSSVKTLMVPPNNLGPDLAGKPVNETLYRGMIRSLMYLTATRLDIQFSIVLCVRYQSNPKESHLIDVKRKFRCCANILWLKSQLSDYDIHYKMAPIFCDNTSAIAVSNNPVLHSRTKHIDIRYHFIRDHILKGNIELHFIPTEYQLADIFTKPLNEPTFTRLKVDDEWQEALTLDFKTFITSIGLDYNNGEYVDHPSPEAVKAELAKIVTNPNYLNKTSVLKNSFPVAWRILFTFVIQVLSRNY